MTHGTLYPCVLTENVSPRCHTNEMRHITEMTEALITPTRRSTFAPDVFASVRPLDHVPTVVFTVRTPTSTHGGESSVHRAQPRPLRIS